MCFPKRDGGDRQRSDRRRYKAGSTDGEILNTLLEEVLEDPKKNQKAYLLERALNVYEEK